jgi:hypothetical protein
MNAGGGSQPGSGAGSDTNRKKGRCCARPPFSRSICAAARWATSGAVPAASSAVTYRAAAKSAGRGTPPSAPASGRRPLVQLARESARSGMAR